MAEYQCLALLSALFRSEWPSNVNINTGRIEQESPENGHGEGESGDDGGDLYDPFEDLSFEYGDPKTMYDPEISSEDEEVTKEEQKKKTQKGNSDGALYVNPLWPQLILLGDHQQVGALARFSL